MQGLSVLPSVIANKAKQSHVTFMRLLQAYGPRNDNRMILDRSTYFTILM